MSDQLPIPDAALDAAEKEWYARVQRGQYDPPRDHIRALFEVAMPFLVPIQGEVTVSDYVSNNTPDEPAEPQPKQEGDHWS